MARTPIPCGIHEDWPCCGCETEILTGEDALDRMQEEDDLMYGDDLLPGEDMDGDFDSAMASAGHGMDEDYGPCSMSAWEDQFEEF
jgi:hypothetical protein